MKRQALLVKRELILQRIAVQRTNFAVETAAFSRPLAYIDIGRTVVWKVKQHPYFLAGSALVFSLLLGKHLNKTGVVLYAFRWLLKPKEISNILSAPHIHSK